MKSDPSHGVPAFTHLCPFNQASPSVTSVSPVSILKVEVFPAPFTPRRPKHCEGRAGSPAALALPAVPSVCLCVHLSLTSPGGMATQSLSTAGAFLRRYTCVEDRWHWGLPPGTARGSGGSGAHSRVQPHAPTLVRSFSSRRWPCGAMPPTLARSLATSRSSSPSEGSSRARGLWGQ